MAAAGKAVKTKLFIGNLDPATQSSELNELFSSYGAVLEASVIKDYGFVHFGSIEEAEKAVAGLNNKEFHGKRLRVELSTSTVRHRPGQPEPASALRNSRARHGGATANNGSRYTNTVPPTSGVGPMRHSSSWARHDARPYAPMAREPAGMPPEYGLTPPPYDRSRPYDPRSDGRPYYPDGPDQGYPPGYDMPGYGGGARHADDLDPYASRHYRHGPGPSRGDAMPYGSNRPYDRHADVPPVDPYYDHGPAPEGDPYRNYDMYSKYYPGRGRDSDYPEPSGVPPPPRDYDPYPNYRHDPYGPSNGQAPYRHHSSVASPPQHHGAYPPSHRQQPPLYPSGPSASGAPYPPAPPTGPSHSHYYGAHHRA